MEGGREDPWSGEEGGWRRMEGGLEDPSPVTQPWLVSGCPYPFSLSPSSCPGRPTPASKSLPRLLSVSQLLAWAAHTGLRSLPWLLPVSLSPCLPISPSPLLPVSPFLCLPAPGLVPTPPPSVRSPHLPISLCPYLPSSLQRVPALTHFRLCGDSPNSDGDVVSRHRCNKRHTPEA